VPVQFVLPRQVKINVAGRPYAGASAYFYQASTDVLQTVYQDQALTTPHDQPVTADDDGYWPVIWLNTNAVADYRLVVNSRTGVLLDDVDNIPRRQFSSDDISQTLDSLALTSAESTLAVTPVNYAYPPGHVYRYGVNTTPGTTDMTAALNTAASVCRQGRYTLQLPPETCLVSSTLDFSGIAVEGTNQEQGPNILATSAQFHIIKSTGSSSFRNFGVRGGWDGTTAGQDGDVFHLVDDAPGGDGFAYTISFWNVNISFAKKRGIYWQSGAYGSLYRVQCYSCGLHGLELFGSDAAHATTTIWVGGQTVFTSTPNGNGAKLTNCVLVSMDGVTMEATGGLEVQGTSSRALSFNRVYQEFNVGTSFLNFGSSGGIGCSITNCVGIGLSISDPTNWQDVYLSGNSGIIECATPLANRILQNDSGSQTVSATGDVTVAQVDLVPGTYLLHGTVQTIVSSGGGNITLLACKITSNVADSGLANTTGGSFAVGADEQTYNPNTSNSDLRVTAFTVVRVTANTTYYLRSKIAISGTVTIGYRGHLDAVKFQ